MEWTVVLTLGTLMTLVVAVGKPVISLTKAITTLTVTVSNLQEDVGNLMKKNTDSHTRLWEHNDEQDKQLADHECRISDLERGK